MNSIKSGDFKKFENILKKSLEIYQDKDDKVNTEDLYQKFNFFNEKRHDIESEENEINSNDRPLRVGFVGGFSTGKSSMINSLIGEDILGVKLEPATAKITEISFGDKSEIYEVVNGDESWVFNKISLEAYQESSVRRDDKSKKISHYILKYPSKNLAKFTIVDTPGFSSTSKEDDELTMEWIKTLDLLVWIFDANKVAGKDELVKLKEVGDNIKVIGVINKIDLKSPSVREKIRNEALDNDLLNSVFFYSSTKVLNEHKKSIIFNKELEKIKLDIGQSINNSEDFKIVNSNSEIAFKSKKRNSYTAIAPLKRSGYTEYYDLLISNIDKIRDNEIKSILRNSLDLKRRDFSNSIKSELIHLQSNFNKDLEKLIKNVTDSKESLKKAESTYEKLYAHIEEKMEANFAVFYKSLFKDLGNLLFSKRLVKGVFSDDIFIDMLYVDDENGEKILNDFLVKAFRLFLNDCFEIYEKCIDKSLFKDFSKIKEIIEDKYHIIYAIVHGLVSSSTASIIGYQRNYEPYKVDSYIEAKDFQESNIDLVVPDEFLRDAINKVLISDLIVASVTYESDLELKIDSLQSQKEEIMNVIKMIDSFFNK